MTGRRRGWGQGAGTAAIVALVLWLTYMSAQRDCADWRICRAQGYSWYHCHESIFNRR